MVDVFHEGAGYPGELRSWDQADDGSWSGMAEWTVGARVDLLGARAVRDSSSPPRAAPAAVEPAGLLRLRELDGHHSRVSSNLLERLHVERQRD